MLSQDLTPLPDEYVKSRFDPLADTKKMGKQMSDQWINENIRKMKQSKDADVRKTARILKNNKKLIKKKANVLDPNGNNRWNKIKIPE